MLNSIFYTHPIIIRKMRSSEIVEELIEQLRRRGLHPKREVRTKADGFADIVTEQAVYQVVGNMTAKRLAKAIQWVAADREAIDPKLRAIVIGKRSGEPIQEQLEEAKRLNVTVLFWGEQA